MYQLVIFDLDGTLLNTIEDITNSLNLALAEVGCPLVTKEACQYMVGKGVKVLIEKAVADPNKRDAVQVRYMAHYALRQRDKTHPYPGICDAVKAIKELGVKTAVLSNKPHHDAQSVVAYYFGNDLFDVVMGQKPHNHPKPALDGCYEIESELNIHDHIMFVGDTSVDMATAVNAGYDSVAVTWGFRKPEEITPHTYIIDEPHQLLEIVRSSR
jgi:phosphoglycolate phosphatase